MVQPKDVEVKHNGRVVRRMVVRRPAIYVTGGKDVIINKSYDHSVKM